MTFFPHSYFSLSDNPFKYLSSLSSLCSAFLSTHSPLSIVLAYFFSDLHSLFSIYFYLFHLMSQERCHSIESSVKDSDVAHKNGLKALKDEVSSSIVTFHVFMLVPCLAFCKIKLIFFSLLIFLVLRTQWLYFIVTLSAYVCHKLCIFVIIHMYVSSII